MHDTCEDAILTSETDKLACPMRPVGAEFSGVSDPQRPTVHQAPIDQQGRSIRRPA
jgi:hypothetical protein